MADSLKTIPEHTSHQERRWKRNKRESGRDTPMMERKNTPEPTNLSA